MVTLHRLDMKAGWLLITGHCDGGAFVPDELIADCHRRTWIHTMLAACRRALLRASGGR